MIDNEKEVGPSKASAQTPCSVNYFVSDKCRHQKRIESLNERIKNLENALSFARDCMMQTGGKGSPIIIDINDADDSCYRGFDDWGYDLLGAGLF